MRIEVCHVGRTKSKWLMEGEQFYLKKCRRYGKVEVKYLPAGKHNNPVQSQLQEAKTIEDHINKGQSMYTILLDERGRLRTSVEFAKHIDNIAMHRGGSIRFITGGPYGVSDEIRDRCDEMISLSAMVFTHEMVRTIFMEQLYRAFTILRGESYHHV